MRWAGYILALTGAGLLVVGAVLPWLRFRVFGAEFAVPGVLTWGAATLFLALVVLSALRRAPWAALAAGLVAMFLGGRAGSDLGRVAVQRAIAVQRSLVSVNARLEQVGLPPIEPLGRVGRRADYVGPGPGWTLWGGAAAALGAGLVLAGDRRMRGCSACGARWARERLDAIAFCPVCGADAGGAAVIACPRCHRRAALGDSFCVACGENLKITRVPGNQA